MSWLKNNSGICLTELMIAMAAGMIVFSATLEMLNHFQQRLSFQQDMIALHQDQRIGMRILEEELRIANSGSMESHSTLLQANQQDIEFEANVGGYTTSLTRAISTSEEALAVVDGAGWAKGKRILICASDRCAESRLAQDGQRTSLSLATPILQSFPSGSEITIANRVRYYLSRSRNGIVNLMRQVDGGANPIVSDVTFFALSYVDKTGRPTADPAAVARVKIQLAVGRDSRSLTSEVGLRAR